MAIFHFALTPIHAGTTATASAYRRRVEKYAAQGGYEGGGVVGWTGAPEDLWKAAEAAEVPARRRPGHRPQNRRTGYSLVIAIPHELNEEQRLALVRGFSLALRDRHGIAVQYDIHKPAQGSDPRQFHAHLMLTSRRVSGGLFGEKERALVHLPNIKELRKLWENRVNKALEAAGRTERVSGARKPRGMARAHLPIMAYKAGVRVKPPAVVEAIARKAEAEAAAAAKELAAAEVHLRMIERAITLGPRTASGSGAGPRQAPPPVAAGPAGPATVRRCRNEER